MINVDFEFIRDVRLHPSGVLGSQCRWVISLCADLPPLLTGLRFPNSRQCGNIVDSFPMGFPQGTPLLTVYCEFTIVAF